MPLNTSHYTDKGNLYEMCDKALNCSYIYNYFKYVMNN